ncbi:MAG: hypothetical protein HYS87_01410 [Candidatus Colwellbacteria bacterium]|nr:hypothetical protein [Candidatus Colwellbacteria bacterium]
MINYSNLTPETIQKYIQNATGVVKTLLESEEISETLANISNKYNLDVDPDDDITFHQIVTFAILGLIKPEEVAGELKKFIDINEKAIAGAAEEVRAKILSRMTQTPPKQQIKETEHPAPYVLHAAEEIKPVAKPQNDYLRPVFKEREEGRQAGSTAKIDIGEGDGYEPKKEVKSARTAPPKVKIINYSALQTPEDPFKPKQTGPKNNVDPENIIDLKDGK